MICFCCLFCHLCNAKMRDHIISNMVLQLSTPELHMHSHRHTYNSPGNGNLTIFPGSHHLIHELTTEGGVLRG